MVRREETIGEDTPIDRAARGLARGASRRAVVRGLAAGLIAAAGGGIASGTLAKKRKNKPQKPTPKPKPEVCERGASIAYLAVPADGSQVFTPVLEQGQRYELRASGFWTTSIGVYDAIDAFAAYRHKLDQQGHMPYHSGVRLGLSVDGASPDIWGAYNPSHTYSLQIAGKGERVPLMMWDSLYTDNGRLLNLEVICLGEAQE